MSAILFESAGTAMCENVEAFVRVTSLIVLIYSGLNILFVTGIGRSLTKNNPSITDELKPLKKYGKLIVNSGRLLIIIGRFSFSNPVAFFLMSLIYFFLALNFNKIAC